MSYEIAVAGFGSAGYRDMVALRYRLLREPLGLRFTDESVGCIDEHNAERGCQQPHARYYVVFDERIRRMDQRCRCARITARHRHGDLAPDADHDIDADHGGALMPDAGRTGQ